VNLVDIPDEITDPLSSIDRNGFGVHKRQPTGDMDVSFSALDTSRDIDKGGYLLHDAILRQEDMKALVVGLSKIYTKHSIVPSGRFLYPSGGYMGWHTNSASRGMRVYLTHTEHGNKSYFRYSGQGGQDTLWDPEGWSMKEFTINDDPLWHCVYAEEPRLSLGFRVIRNLK
jgi:hypothetical protein